MGNEKCLKTWRASTKQRGQRGQPGNPPELLCQWQARPAGNCCCQPLSRSEESICLLQNCPRNSLWKMFNLTILSAYSGQNKTTATTTTTATATATTATTTTTTTNTNSNSHSNSNSNKASGRHSGQHQQPFWCAKPYNKRHWPIKQPILALRFNMVQPFVEPLFCSGECPHLATYI